MSDTLGGRRPRRVYAVLALILGALSLLGCTFFAGIYLGVPAVVLGALGIRSAAGEAAAIRRLSLAGLLLGAAGFVVGLVLVLMVATLGEKLDTCPRQFPTNPDRQALCLVS